MRSPTGTTRDRTGTGTATEGGAFQTGPIEESQRDKYAIRPPRMAEFMQFARILVQSSGGSNPPAQPAPYDSIDRAEKRIGSV